MGCIKPNLGLKLAFRLDFEHACQHARLYEAAELEAARADVREADFFWSTHVALSQTETQKDPHR